jgi:hypothetical protein
MIKYTVAACNYCLRIFQVKPCLFWLFHSLIYICEQNWHAFSMKEFNSNNYKAIHKYLVHFFSLILYKSGQDFNMFKSLTHIHLTLQVRLNYILLLLSVRYIKQ